MRTPRPVRGQVLEATPPVEGELRQRRGGDREEGKGSAEDGKGGGRRGDNQGRSELREQRGEQGGSWSMGEGTGEEEKQDTGEQMGKGARGEGEVASGQGTSARGTTQSGTLNVNSHRATRPAIPILALATTPQTKSSAQVPTETQMGLREAKSS